MSPALQKAFQARIEWLREALPYVPVTKAMAPAMGTDLFGLN